MDYDNNLEELLFMQNLYFNLSLFFFFFLSSLNGWVKFVKLY
jgi:hypothetical protein